LVVITHLVRAFDPELFFPTSSKEAQPRILQWPFIRVFLQGRLGVSIFSFVTGYVCALKPIRQARNGNTEAALVGVAKSAFRRIPRIVLPTTIATVMIWFLCQFGIFQVAKHTDSAWLTYTAPEMTPYFGDAVRSLFFNVIETWVYGRNIYEQNDWNLQPLMKGAMLVYVSIFATIYMQPKYRMMTSLAQWVYYYIGSDCKPLSLISTNNLRDFRANITTSRFWHAILLRHVHGRSLQLRPPPNLVQRPPLDSHNPLPYTPHPRSLPRLLPRRPLRMGRLVNLSPHLLNLHPPRRLRRPALLHRLRPRTHRSQHLLLATPEIPPIQQLLPLARQKQLRRLSHPRNADPNRTDMVFLWRRSAAECAG
jgi:hypothetical protein